MSTSQKRHPATTAWQGPTWPATLGLLLAAYAAINLASWQMPLFWDAIIKARRATWQLENGFAPLLPAELDSGHPPFFTLYLAGVWKLLGRTLWATHLAVLPFALGIAWQAGLLARRLFAPRHWPWALALLLLEPTLLAQNVQTSADLALLFFYLLGVNALLAGRPALFALGLLGLLAVSQRGMVMGGALAATQALLWWLSPADHRPPRLLPWLLAYGGPGLALALWLAYHWHAPGWLLFTPSAQWADGRQALGWQGAVRNLAIVLRNHADFGRLFLGLGMALLLASALWRGRRRSWSPATRVLAALLAAYTLVLCLAFLPFSNPIGSRYHMAGYLFLAWLALSLLLDSGWPRLRKAWMLALWCAALASGHLWVYPDGVAKNWDSSLAHLAFFEPRARMNQYLVEQGVPIDSLGSQFPYYEPEQLELRPSGWQIRHFDLGRDRWVIESNVINDFPDSALLALRESWVLEREFRQLWVHVRLYRRP